MPETVLLGCWVKANLAAAPATTLATCVGPVLLTPETVTLALSAPSEVGCVLKVTVNCVVVAAVTVPTAPLLKVTVLLAGVVEKPVPAMFSVVVLCTRSAVLGVIVTEVTVATCTAAPLD